MLTRQVTNREHVLPAAPPAQVWYNKISVIIDYWLAEANKSKTDMNEHVQHLFNRILMKRTLCLLKGVVDPEPDQPTVFLPKRREVRMEI